ncbi:unnamed protein product, partial [marine sediment metagenome]
ALAHLQKGLVPRARRYASRALVLAPDDVNIRALSKRLGMGGLLAKLRVRLTPKRKGNDTALHTRREDGVWE